MFKSALMGFWLVGLAFAASAGFAETPKWGKADKGYVLNFEQGAITCDARGRLALRPNGQPALDVGFFMCHDAWVYEALESGKGVSAELLPEGALRLRGLWGARDGSAPLRYSLTLTPSESQVLARLEVEKTAALKLRDGIWAKMRTQMTKKDARLVYLFPTGDVPVGKEVEGVFKQTFIGQAEGPSLFFRGERMSYLRSKVGKDSHGFEVRLSSKRDFPMGEKLAVPLTLGFAAMPKILRPAVTCAKPLALSAMVPPEVPLYGKCEIDVKLEGTWDNPYDPDQVALDAAVTTASGKTYTMPGFFMVPQRRETEGVEDFMVPTGVGAWRVRLCAAEPGPMRVTLTARDRSGIKTYTLPEPIRVAANPKAKGFVRVSKADAHYLAFDNGAGFVPIGHNVPIYQGSNGMSVKDILEKMAANGENWNRWWMSKRGLGLEWEPKLGWYRQAQAAKLDWLLDDAGRLDMYYMLCMDTHQDFRQDGWKANPFNAARGGPCKTAGEWFTSEEAKKHYRKRLRYTVARWGYSPHMLCWEFGNEFEGWADAKQETIIAWHREMAPVLAGLDPYDHLISTSWWSKTGPEACWQIPELSMCRRTVTRTTTSMSRSKRTTTV